ncbi:MAG: DUF3667 domain-containing protein [Flavobacteriaceae bacterium]
MDCKNCKNSVLDSDGFCSKCGARKVDNRLTFRYFFKEFSEKVLSVDNKLLKTFIDLFVKPDKVIESYINGVRKRYIDPFGFLLISITLSGLSIYLMRESTVNALSDLNTTQSEAMAAYYKNMMNFIYDYNAFITALTIPLYALISWIVFLNKKMFNYVEHVIIYLYSTAQFSIVNTFFFIIFYFIGLEFSNPIMTATLLFSILYNAYILKKLFKLSFMQLIIKILYFLLVLLVLYIIFGIIAGIVMFLTMDPEALKQLAPKK